jgi:CDP-glucose 4,6-dehydratase
MSYRELANFYQGKTVLVTGHTGFKGSWLCHALIGFGAKVAGMALPPATPRDIYELTGLEKIISHGQQPDIRLDIRDGERVQSYVRATEPEIIFHLAAQPLVRESYQQPLKTVTTNVIGTANVLEAVRHCRATKAAVIITTDKVYMNHEWIYGYREQDALGGYDPYSGSKAAADIVTQSYLQSFFNPKDYGSKHDTLIGIARAGNVIGGGDWSPDRIVPDIMRAVLYGDGVVTLRQPQAVRPWEHVLEAVSGYLLLGQLLYDGELAASGAFNFGPDLSSWQTVGDMTKKLLTLLGKGSIKVEPDASKHEANMLTLDTTKARRQLGWQPRWNFEQTMRATAEWYSVAAADKAAASSVTKRQIETYFQEEE